MMSKEKDFFSMQRVQISLQQTVMGKSIDFQIRLREIQCVVNSQRNRLIEAHISLCRVVFLMPT